MFIKREILIDEIHTRIDVSRIDTVLKGIQKISDEMLNDIEILEINFWQNLNKLKPTKTNTFIQMETSKLEELFRNPYISPQLMENLRLEYVRELNVLQMNYKKFQLFKNDLVKPTTLLNTNRFDKLNSFHTAWDLLEVVLFIILFSSYTFSLHLKSFLIKIIKYSLS